MAVTIRLNYANLGKILRGEEGGVETDLIRRAQAIAAAAGPGHEVDSERGGKRARASVRTDTIAAMRSEATDRTLTRAIDAGRG